jgi:hypothetical protein
MVNWEECYPRLVENPEAEKEDGEWETPYEGLALLITSIIDLPKGSPVKEAAEQHIIGILKDGKTTDDTIELEGTGESDLGPEQAEHGE